MSRKIHQTTSTSRFAVKALPALVGAAAVLLSMGASAETLRIGTLPAADSIVLHVAKENGLYEKAGLEVELVPFKSALELGAAMRAGRLDGHFGDLMNVFTQNETGIPQKVVFTTTHTIPQQRAFALIASPKSATAPKSFDELKTKKDVTTAMSSSTIIHYLLDRMTETEKLPEGALKNLEVKQIPIRMQMLLGGKVDTALLPEPLVTVVESKGGKVLWDDRNLNEALAVVALKSEKLDPKTVDAFRKATAEAARVIEADPVRYRAVMVQKGLLPAPVAEGYKMVAFSFFGTKDGLPPLPTPEEVKRVGEWMVGQGMLKAVPAWDQVVVPAAE